MTTHATRHDVDDALRARAARARRRLLLRHAAVAALWLVALAFVLWPFVTASR